MQNKTEVSLSLKYSQEYGSLCLLHKLKLLREAESMTLQ